MTVTEGFLAVRIAGGLMREVRHFDTFDEAARFAEANPGAVPTYVVRAAAFIPGTLEAPVFPLVSETAARPSHPR